MVKPKTFKVEIDGMSLCEEIEGLWTECVFYDEARAKKANQLAELLYELFGPAAAVWIYTPEYTPEVK